MSDPINAYYTRPPRNRKKGSRTTDLPAAAVSAASAGAGGLDKLDCWSCSAAASLEPARSDPARRPEYHRLHRGPQGTARDTEPRLGSAIATFRTGGIRTVRADHFWPQAIKL